MCSREKPCFQEAHVLLEAAEQNRAWCPGDQPPLQHEHRLLGSPRSPVIYNHYSVLQVQVQLRSRFKPHLDIPAAFLQTLLSPDLPPFHRPPCWESDLSNLELTSSFPEPSQQSPGPSSASRDPHSRTPAPQGPSPYAVSRAPTPAHSVIAPLAPLPLSCSAPALLTCFCFPISGPSYTKKSFTLEYVGPFLSFLYWKC